MFKSICVYEFSFLSEYLFIVSSFKIDILAVVISAMDQKQVNRYGKESIVQKFVLVNEEYELLLLIIISYIELL